VPRAERVADRGDALATPIDQVRYLPGFLVPHRNRVASHCRTSIGSLPNMRVPPGVDAAAPSGGCFIRSLSFPSDGRQGNDASMGSRTRPQRPLTAELHKLIISPLRVQEFLVRVMTRTNAQRTGIGGHPWATQRPVPDSPTAADWKVVTFVAARPKRQERS
jgi:hypothetical protein